MVLFVAKGNYFQFIPSNRYLLSYCLIFHFRIWVSMNMIMFCQESRHFLDIDKFRRMLEQDPGVSKTRHRH